MGRINEVLQAVDRTHFLPLEFRDSAPVDAPIAIGYGQTNSQPTTVRLMLEWLDPQPGEKILDVGSGSGWTTALLARLVEPAGGSVYSVEKVPELVKFGAENCKRAGIQGVRFFAAGGTYGLPQFAPYDRILVSASAQEVPDALLDQLAPGGRLVIPVNTSIDVINKTNNGQYESTEYPGFMFVPLL